MNRRKTITFVCGVRLDVLKNGDTNRIVQRNDYAIKQPGSHASPSRR